MQPFHAVDEQLGRGGSQSQIGRSNWQGVLNSSSIWSDIEPRIVPFPYNTLRKIKLLVCQLLLVAKANTRLSSLPSSNSSLEYSHYIYVSALNGSRYHSRVCSCSCGVLNSDRPSFRPGFSTVLGVTSLAAHIIYDTTRILSCVVCRVSYGLRKRPRQCPPSAILGTARNRKYHDPDLNGPKRP